MTTIDVTQKKKALGIVRQTSLRRRELLASAVVIEISPIQVLREGEVSFARIGTQASQVSNCRVGQSKTLRSMIVLLPVKLIVRVRELIVGKSKQWVAR